MTFKSTGMRKMLISFVVAAHLLLLTGCGSSAKLYRDDDPSRIYSGTLDDTTNTALRNFLSGTTSMLKDTIIIKFDYNHDKCWEMLDRQNKDYIERILKGYQKRVEKARDERVDVSVFTFRERGKNISKSKKWDNSIVIDSSAQLMNLLFKERSMCGNSIIVLPDKKFVFLRSDSHFEAINLTGDQIESYLQ